MKVVGIIGEGKMGTNLFHYIAGFPFEMRWLVSSSADAEKIRKSWSKKTARALAAGLADDQAAERMDRAVISGDPEILGDCDLVIEAITEDPEAKRALFTRLDPILPPNCILASNSSSILPSKLIPSDKRAASMVGMHFFYPVGLKNIAELVVPAGTSEETKGKCTSFLDCIGRNYLFQEEGNAFLLNRIFLEFQAEAFNIAEEGLMPPSLIDRLVRERMFPLGPFECMDAVGIDVMLPSVRNYILHYRNREKYAFMLKTMENLLAEGRPGIGAGLEVPGDTDHPGVTDTIVEERLKYALEDAIDRLSCGTVFDKLDLIAGLDEYLGK